jgi:hypothetical protein
MAKARLLAAVTATALLAAVALAACGGSDDSSSADQDQITQAINAAATSGDPSACTQYQTQNFLDQTNDSKGQAAVKECQQDADSTAAESVDVSDIEVDGDTATAKAAATGSIFDGQTLDIGLVKEGDQWKLDEFKGFQDFDKDAMVAAFKGQLEKESGATPQAVNCIVEQFQKASDEQIEATFTGNDPQAENRIFGPCEQYFQ